MLKMSKSEPAELQDKRGRWKKQAVLNAGFLCGTLLMLAGIFPKLAPVQAFAFVPLLLALRIIRKWRVCLRTGYLMGLGFVAPQVLWLRLPRIITLILVAYFLVAMLFLAVSDHFKKGPNLLVAGVDVYNDRTIFSRFGNWFVALSGVFVAIQFILCVSFRRRVRI